MHRISSNLIVMALNLIDELIGALNKELLSGFVSSRRTCTINLLQDVLHALARIQLLMRLVVLCNGYGSCTGHLVDG